MTIPAPLKKDIEAAANKICFVHKEPGLENTAKWAFLIGAQFMYHRARSEAFKEAAQHLLAMAEKYDTGQGHGHALVRCARELEATAEMEIKE